MNDLCTICNQQTTDMNMVTITPYHEIDSRAQMLGLTGTRGRRPRSLTAHKKEWRGICNSCAARIGQVIMSMRDPLARNR